MTARFEIVDGKVVVPERELSGDELTALERLFAKRPDLKPERPDVTQHWTEFERQAVRWFAQQAQRFSHPSERTADAR